MSPNTREGRPPSTDHPLFAWMTTAGETLETMGAKLEVSRSLVGAWCSGSRAISRKYADRLTYLTSGAVDWTSWPLLHGKAGWFHHGTLVPLSEMPALRLKLSPAPGPSGPLVGVDASTRRLLGGD